MLYVNAYPRAPKPRIDPSFSEAGGNHEEQANRLRALERLSSGECKEVWEDADCGSACTNSAGVSFGNTPSHGGMWPVEITAAISRIAAGAEHWEKNFSQVPQLFYKAGRRQTHPSSAGYTAEEAATIIAKAKAMI